MASSNADIRVLPKKNCSLTLTTPSEEEETENLPSAEELQKLSYKELNQYISILFNTKLRFQNSHSFLYFLVAANIKPRCCKWNWLGWEWITGRLANNHIHSCWIKPHLKTFDNHIHKNYDWKPRMFVLFSELNFL